MNALDIANKIFRLKEDVKCLSGTLFLIENDIDNKKLEINNLEKKLEKIDEDLQW